MSSETFLFLLYFLNKRLSMYSMNVQNHPRRLAAHALVQPARSLAKPASNLQISNPPTSSRAPQLPRYMIGELQGVC